MDIELVEISDFLSQYPPFDLLPRDVVSALPEKMQTAYARRGKVVLEPGEPNNFLYILRSGAVETHNPEGQLLARLGTGDAFGINSVLGEDIVINRNTALEDSLLYLLPKPEFDRLRKEYPHFAYFFQPTGAARLRTGLDQRSTDEQLNLMAQRIDDILTQGPIIIGPDETIQAAAVKMREHNVSCLPVCAQHKLIGIVTDTDMRNRVVAGGLDVTAPVSSVMTPHPITLNAEDFAFDAVLTMSQRNISHVPILKDDQLVGVITNTNLVRRQTMSAVYMVGDIHRRSTYEEIADVVRQIPHLLVHLVDAGASSHNIGHIITSITDAATMRLAWLAEQKLGPPPVSYVWMASGSQARQEQTGVSDQDNCMIIGDSYDPQEHGAYFKDLAQFICDGLNVSGYIYCPGEMMAITDKWRQPLAEWRRYFTKWIEEPEPKALMLSSIFFDLRPIWGDRGLFSDLQGMIMEKAEKNGIFLAHMVGNALTHRPPIGFFRNFVLIGGDEHKSEYNLKHNGVVPIVDIARVNALEEGIRAVNTHDRLEAERRVGGGMSTGGARDLLDAYEVIAITRLRHQAEQIRNGEKPSNYMNPDDLSHFERNHLRDAFAVVKTMQSAMAHHHHVGG